MDDLIELVPEAVLLVGPEDGRLLAANGHALEVYGYGWDELSSLTIRDLRAPETHDGIGGQIAQASATGIRFETVHRRKDGSTFPVEVNSRGATSGGRRVVVSVVRDLSEQKRNDAETRSLNLRLNEDLSAQLSPLLAASDDRVDEAIVQAQRGLCHVLGMERSAIWQGSPETPTILRLTHWCALDEVPAVPEGITANRTFPWFTEQLLAGHPVVVPDVSSLPEEAAVDKASLAHYRDRSTLAIPFVQSSGQVDGAISFAATTPQKAWSEVVLLHCRLIAQVISSVLSRTRAHAELRQGEAQLRAMVDQAMVGVAQVGLDGRFVRVNQRLCAMLGYSRGELLGRTFASVTHPDDVGVDTSAVQRMITGQLDEYTHEKRYRRKDGSTAWAALATRLLRNDRHEPLYFSSFLLDISERKAGEEQLDLMKTAIERSLHAAYWFDANGRLIYVNDEGCRQLGYTRAEVSSMNLWDISATAKREGWPEIFAAIKAKGLISVEGIHRRKDGSTFPAQIVSWYSKHGDREYVPGFAVDLTERRKADQERAALQDQLYHAQKLESLGRLAGGVAHDFNNLLGVILGNAEVLQDECSESSSAWDQVAQIRKAGERGAGLIRQLLAFSRKQILLPQVFDLDSAVADVKKMLLRILKENITVDHVRSTEPLFVEVDRGQMDQILINLAVNAGDAMPDGGTLRIQVAAEDVALVDAAAGRASLAPGHYVVLTMRDTGVGIDPEILPRIFDPFFTTKAVGRGTGLGLSTVYGIVKQSRGDVSVVSEVGRGATFKVLLPRTTAPDPGQARDSTSKPNLRGHGVVLVAEDDHDLRTLVRRTLEKVGFNVLEANNGLAAEGVFDDFGGKIDLLLADLIMPIRGGVQLAERLQARASGLKVLFMSGYAEGADLPRGQPDFPFIRKPFTPGELVEKIQEVLGAAAPDGRRH